MSSGLNIDDAWKAFCSNEHDFVESSDFNSRQQTSSIVAKAVPRSTELYISTKTMIAFLDVDGNMIDLNRMFWVLPLIQYHESKCGIIKKQMKFTCNNQEEDDKIDKCLEGVNVYSKDLLSSTTVKSGYKNVQKVSIGLSKKDIICYRMKPKSVFYNCFALVIRVRNRDKFKEVHLKLFNTGKMEIPGIQNDDILFKCLDLVVETLKKINVSGYYVNKDSTPPHNEVTYKQEVDTVLINSNFNCGYFVKRDVMFNILRNKFNIITLFDPCSYPGVQSKFYYNSNKPIQNGRCECGVKKCNKKNVHSCREISFMIFRTGSVLIVGHADEHIIQHIYGFLTNIFVEHFDELNDGIAEPKVKDKSKQKRRIKKNVIVTSDYYQNTIVS